MRPASSAFTDSTNVLVTKKSPVELDFVLSGKPSLVLSVVDVKVNQLLNNERSYVFHWLNTTYHKRPPNPKMTRWVDQITRVSKTAVKRRLTYLGNSPKP